MIVVSSHTVGLLSTEAVRKRGEVRRLAEHSEILYDFLDSERSEGSKKRTEKVCVNKRGSFNTTWTRSGPSRLAAPADRSRKPPGRFSP